MRILRGRSTGIILILASGIAVIIALLALALMGMARFSAGQAASIVSSAQIHSAAASGMEYAAARLVAEGRPRVSRGAAGRGDDWTFRDGFWAGLETARNPSYAHGEPWIDSSSVDDGVDNDGDNEIDETGEADRIFVTTEASRDLDGDGRFGAWSGRLRGGRGERDRRFTLRIGCEEGRIPLNAGVIAPGYGTNGLDDDLDGSVDEADEQAEDLDGMCASDGLDNDGDLLTDEADEAVPDHRDDRVQYHASLAMALNNLGVIAGVATRRWDVPAGSGTEPIRASWIGIDLIKNRPVGGYRTWGDVERILKSLPNAPPFEGAPYTQADLDAIRPYVSLGPYESLPETGRCRISQPLSYPSYVPISFWVAPREVLASLWRYLETYSPTLRFDDTTINSMWLDTNDFPLEAPPTSLLCPQSGLPYAPGGPKAPVNAILWPREAEALADEILLLRQGAAPPAWREIRERFLRKAPALFEVDATALAGYPDFQRAWGLFKAGLAFQAVAMDPYPYRGQYDPLLAWSGWGLDADAATAATEHPPSAGFERICRVMYPPACDFAVPVEWAPFLSDPDMPYQTAWTLGGSYAPVVKPQGLTLAPPVRFSVESRGWSASAPGRGAVLGGGFRAAERLELTSQEDFENLTGGRRWVGRGITLLDPSPAARHGCSGISDPRIVSLPRVNLHGRGALLDTGIPAIPNVLKAPYHGYSRLYGALGLAPYVAGRQGAGLYFPIRDDFDGKLNTPAPPPAWMEHWSEWDAALYASAQFSTAAPKPPYRLDSVAGNPTPDFRIPGLTPDTECHEGTGPYAATTRYGVYTPRHGSVDVTSLVMPWYYRVLFQPAGHIELASMEGWMGPSSALYLSDPAGSSRVILYAERARRASPDRAGTLYTVYIKWSDPVGAGNPQSERSWFIADSASPNRRVPGFHFAALTLRKKPLATKTVTEVTLSVDGSTGSEDGTMRYDHEQLQFGTESGVMRNPWIYNLKLRAMDEVRFRKADGVTTASGIHGLGRFVPQGTFQSPIYSMDGPARLLESQWTGIVPAGFVDGADQPINPFTVEVEGFSDSAGASSLGRKPLGATSADVADLSRIYDRPVKAFRYWVTIRAAGLAGVLDETPLFESIWLRLQRKGSAPGWSAWESR